MKTTLCISISVETALKLRQFISDQVTKPQDRKKELEEAQAKSDLKWKGSKWKPTVNLPPRSKFANKLTVSSVVESALEAYLGKSR